MSADGRKIVTASDNDPVRVWTAGAVEPIQLDGHFGAVTTGAITPDGRRVITGSNDGTIRFWDADLGQQMLTFRDHTTPVVGVALFGQRVVSWSKERRATIGDWSPRQGVTLAGHEREVKKVAAATNGRRVVTGSLDWTAQVWDAATGHRVAGPLRHNAFVTDVAISKDGERVLTASDDYSVRAWDVGQGKELNKAEIGKLDTRSHLVTSMGLSEDGTWAVVSLMDKSLRIWKVGPDKPREFLTHHQREVLSVAISKDGRCVVTGSEDTEARIWHLDKGTTPLLLKHDKPVTAVLISGDGHLVITSSKDNILRAWDTADGKQRQASQPIANGIDRVALSEDRKQVAVTDEMGVTRVWQIDTNQFLPYSADVILAHPTHLLPGGGRVIPSGNQVFLVAPRMSDEEIRRRREWMRPDPEWHLQQQAQAEREKNPYALAVHRSLEFRARGMLAREAGDDNKAEEFFRKAADLWPQRPAHLGGSPQAPSARP